MQGHLYAANINLDFAQQNLSFIGSNEQALRRNGLSVLQTDKKESEREKGSLREGFMV